MAKLWLKAGREKSLLRRHPWIFSGAVATVSGGAEAGDEIEVVDANGEFLAWAAYSPASQLIARVWSFNHDEQVGREFFQRRINQAVELRRQLGLLAPQGGERLIFSEADGLPGIIVDRVRDFAVLQSSSAGAERWKRIAAELLLEIPEISGVFERSDAGIRKLEGLKPITGHLCGKLPPDSLEISEDDMRFAIDIRHGQKTGFYFDLRSARRYVRKFASGRRVANIFAYTGGFAVAALKGGATEVLNVDSSAPALAQAEINLKLNGFNRNWHNQEIDAFTGLRQLTAAGEKFDMVILDPPKLIDSRKSLIRGCRAYQDLARLGFKLLNPGGMMFNFSCSGLLEPELLQKITAAAAQEADCQAQILFHLAQAPDHPTDLAVPETAYLKGLVTRKC